MLYAAFQNLIFERGPCIDKRPSGQTVRNPVY